MIQLLAFGVLFLTAAVLILGYRVSRLEEEIEALKLAVENKQDKVNLDRWVGPGKVSQGYATRYKETK